MPHGIFAPLSQDQGGYGLRAKVYSGDEGTGLRDLARWNAVAIATRGLYPDGWTAHLNSYPFSDLSPSMDWELICQAASGYGERVEDPAEVPAALERALRVVQQEQWQALLNMVSA